MRHVDKAVRPPARRDPASSDFEKRGGYPSSAEPVGQLPRVRPGPGPGGKKPTDGIPQSEPSKR
jgi:hypothetical protein